MYRMAQSINLLLKKQHDTAVETAKTHVLSDTKEFYSSNQLLTLKASIRPSFKNYWHKLSAYKSILNLIPVQKSPNRKKHPPNNYSPQYVKYSC